jgi:hypothetical protein
MTHLNETERKNLNAVAIRTTAFLREFCRKDGVSGLGDFLNGLILAGTTLEYRLDGPGGFAEILDEEAAKVHDMALSKSFIAHQGELAGTKLGEVTAEKTSLSLIVSVACEGRFIEVANELKINKRTMLRMMAMAVVAVVLDDSASSQIAEQRLVEVRRMTREKLATVAEFAGMSDEDLFGDI